MSVWGSCPQKRGPDHPGAAGRGGPGGDDAAIDTFHPVVGLLESVEGGDARGVLREQGEGREQQECADPQACHGGRLTPTRAREKFFPKRIAGGSSRLMKPLFPAVVGVAAGLFCGCGDLNPRQTYNPYLPTVQTGEEEPTVDERMKDFHEGVWRGSAGVTMRPSGAERRRARCASGWLCCCARRARARRSHCDGSPSVVARTKRSRSPFGM